MKYCIERLGIHQSVGHHIREQGRHIGFNHAGAFGNPADGDIPGTDNPFADGYFGVFIRGHHGRFGILDAELIQPLDQFADTGFNFFHRQPFPDDARRTHQKMFYGNF